VFWAIGGRDMRLVSPFAHTTDPAGYVFPTPRLGEALKRNRAAQRREQAEGGSSLSNEGA